ncbi:protein of unknown function [Candidatus Hydrogenisulfobacillus filiaventi]|uniref:Uncharacterized protein n=1 Tax=Candidatus Hydrogenisulfobacillus filiaventi TaxID=2707344 RepID=A0A6F8ZET6_9FIRM|nr:protein of unknown function [Candidatus Hydrogenisulfobacillus filiaventi]
MPSSRSGRRASSRQQPLRPDGQRGPGRAGNHRPLSGSLLHRRRPRPPTPRGGIPGVFRLRRDGGYAGAAVAPGLTDTRFAFAAAIARVAALLAVRFCSPQARWPAVTCNRKLRRPGS